MSETAPCLTITEQRGVTVVQFAERRVLDQMKILAIQQELEAAVDARRRPLVLIDFYNVEFFSSGALSMLVALNTRIKERGGQLRLANILPPIRQIFSLTKLDQVLRISSTRTGALNILARLAEEWAGNSP